MVDSLYEERGRVDDPHLWERVERLGLDLERFERDRRSEAAAARLRRDFQGGVRAGVTGTPAAFAGGRIVERDLEAELARSGADCANNAPATIARDLLRSKAMEGRQPGAPTVRGIYEHV